MSPIAYLFSLPVQDLTQSNAPSFHSWNIPINRISKNTATPKKDRRGLLFANILKIGNNKAISTSKIKNSTTNKKKRVENGDRILLNGSNPHSKGVSFSLVLE